LVTHQDFDLTGSPVSCWARIGMSPARPSGASSANLFVDRLVRFYGRQLAQSGDGDFLVIGGRTGPEGFIATSQIIRPQATPIVVDWQLGISHGLDGVSMALAQRSQIAEVIARGGRSAWDAARDDAARGLSGRSRVSRDGCAALTFFEYSATTGVLGTSEVSTSVADQDDQIGALVQARSRAYLKIDGGRYQLRKPLSRYQRAEG
jgi:hypothetical protein